MHDPGMRRRAVPGTGPVLPWLSRLRRALRLGRLPRNHLQNGWDGWAEHPRMSRSVTCVRADGFSSHCPHQLTLSSLLAPDRRHKTDTSETTHTTPRNDPQRLKRQGFEAEPCRKCSPCSALRLSTSIARRARREPRATWHPNPPGRAPAMQARTTDPQSTVPFGSPDNRFCEAELRCRRSRALASVRSKPPAQPRRLPDRRPNCCHATRGVA
jgi:hypothetical protein